METIADNLSYFKFPISNTVPSKTLSLQAVTKIVMLGELKNITNKVRSGAVEKTDKLPLHHSFRLFLSRNDNEISLIPALSASTWMMSVETRLIASLRTATATASTASNQHISTSADHLIASLLPLPLPLPLLQISTSAHQHIISDLLRL